MTPHTMEPVFREAAQAALTLWGREEGQEDLVQDLWVWYLESKKTQRLLDEIEPAHAVRVVKKAALQKLSRQMLQSNTFKGIALYSSEAVKDHLKGRSTNKYLRRIVPQAKANLEQQNPRQFEAIRSRYEDGLVPLDNAGSQRLKKAHQSLTEHVNILVILDEDSESVDPGVRRATGGHSDPTADTVIALIEKGDEEHELENEEGNVTGTTTYRTELANVFDEWMIRPVLNDTHESRPDIFDGWFNGSDRSEMYRAQVTPEVFPNEKPMLIENWTAEDRELYCGGEYTPGYLRLVKGEA